MRNSRLQPVSPQTCTGLAMVVAFALLSAVSYLAVPGSALPLTQGPDMTHLDKEAFEEMLKKPHEPRLSHYEQAVRAHEKEFEKNGGVKHQAWWETYRDEPEEVAYHTNGTSRVGGRGLKAIFNPLFFPIFGRQGLIAPTLQAASTLLADVNSSLSSFDTITPPATLDWRTTAAMTTVKNQFQCESCWAIATADLVSIANALQAGKGLMPAPPLNPDGSIPTSVTSLDMSIQQICDCTNGNSCCQGGWPEWALQYVLFNNGLAPASSYPYYAKNATCLKVANNLLQAPITGWELIQPRSVFAMKKALAQGGPVLAYVSATSMDFQTYNSSVGVYNGNCTEDLSHVVLIVGYDTDPIGGPYWIVKNSWGTSWGFNGYMKLAMKDGTGKCGITSAPGISLMRTGYLSQVVTTVTYPFQQPPPGPNLCNSFPPLCGTGTCYTQKVLLWTSGGGLFALLTGTTTSNIYVARCACPAGYVENLSGKPKCVPGSPCSANPNPCGSGTCTNNADGTYSCNCGNTAVIGVQADGSMTCVVGKTSYTKTYQLTPTDTCNTVASAFGVTVSTILSLNQGLNCSNLLNGASIIVGNGTTISGCSSAIIVQTGQTCASIASSYLTTTAALQSLNPGLSCTNLLSGQSICVAPGNVATAVTSTPNCGRTYVVDAPVNDCPSIMSKFSLDMPTLLQLNPGLQCNAGALPSTSIICVAAVNSLMATNIPVTCTKMYMVQQGDKCTTIWMASGLTASQFFLLNPGLRCAKPYFQVGTQVCVAGPQTLSTFSNSVPYLVVSGDTLFTISALFYNRCGSYASPANICSQNNLPNCTSALTVGQSLNIPCQWPVGRSCGCAASQWVCGADGNWYSSYCDAVCNYATPATANGCSSCQYGCSGRCGFSQSPSAGTPSWCQSPCPYPPWPPVNWDWFTNSPCDFYVQACSSCCMGSWGYGTGNYWNCLAYCKQYKC